MIQQEHGSSINLELVLAALPVEDWDLTLTPALAAVEEEIRVPVGPAAVTFKRTAVHFDLEQIQVRLTIDTDEENCVVRGRTLTLVVSLLQFDGIAGVGQVASFFTHGGYVGGDARMPRHIDLLDDHKAALLQLIRILGDEMLAKNGGRPCL
jgi:hypothetical protein